MTIEQKCNRYTTICIELWSWFGEPISIGEKYKVPQEQLPIYEIIDSKIKEASSSECSTSKSEYIRECKKWFMENK